LEAKWIPDYYVTVLDRGKDKVVVDVVKVRDNVRVEAGVEEATNLVPVPAEIASAQNAGIKSCM
jgi:hypothetical protein